MARQYQLDAQLLISETDTIEYQVAAAVFVNETSGAAAPVSVTPGVASLTLTSYAPTVTVGANQNVTPGVASLALTGIDP